VKCSVFLENWYLHFENNKGFTFPKYHRVAETNIKNSCEESTKTCAMSFKKPEVILVDGWLHQEEVFHRSCIISIGHLMMSYLSQHISNSSGHLCASNESSSVGQHCSTNESSPFLEENKGRKARDK